MFSLFIKLVLFRIFKLIGFPKILPINYTISVTDSCNSKCKTCNIHRLKTTPLSIEAYESIFKDIGRSPYWVTLSGGEPFLRKDLPQIVSMLNQYCNPKIVNIPTNGILTSKIVEAVKKICAENPKIRIVINVSIDGIGIQHDRIRNVKDNYQKVIDTYKSLKKLKYSNLSIGIHTVISSFNVDNFSNIATTLLRLEPDAYITEIAEERHEMKNFNQGITPDALDYRAAIDCLLHEIKHSNPSGMSRITQSFRVEYYSMVKKLLQKNTRIIPCFAGIASCHISTGGEVWFCCIKAQSIGTIDVDKYSFREIWFSQTAQQQRKKIRKERCYCPLANASYTNMLLNLPTLLRVFYRSYIRWYR